MATEIVLNANLGILAQVMIIAKVKPVRSTYSDRSQLSHTLVLLNPPTQPTLLLRLTIILFGRIAHIQVGYLRRKAE